MSVDYFLRYKQYWRADLALAIRGGRGDACALILALLFSFGYDSALFIRMVLRYFPLQRVSHYPVERADQI